MRNLAEVTSGKHVVLTFISKMAQRALGGRSKD